MTFSQLSVYNNALSAYCGERKLANLTEERHARYLLDDAWANDPIKSCLEMGFWTFALRATQMTYDSEITPEFGYTYGFIKPTDDYVNTYAICVDEGFRSPLLDYADEGGAWFCDLQTIYVKYTSNDSEYGRDYSLWPQSFFEVVSCFMAKKIIRNLTQSRTSVEDLEADMKKILSNAIGKDIIKKPPSFRPRGSWTRARHGAAGTSRRDRSDPYTGG
jgi:hypothetical protein